MALRVVQWTTGNVGKQTVAAIAANPELELVGCYAWSPDKVGREVGELCGLAPLGVRGPDRRLEAREHDLRDGEDDLVLGVVLVVDRRLRDADRVRDHLQRRSRDPVLAEELERGVDNARLRGREGRGAERARGGGGAHEPTVADPLAFRVADRLGWIADRLSREETDMDRKTKSKIRALYVFEAAIFAYLAGTAIAQVYVVYFRN